jgi:hypothetical protein
VRARPQLVGAGCSGNKVCQFAGRRRQQLASGREEGRRLHAILLAQATKLETPLRFRTFTKF